MRVSSDAKKIYETEWQTRMHFFHSRSVSAFVLFWTNGENGTTTFWIKKNSEMNDVLVLFGKLIGYWNIQTSSTQSY